MYLKDNSDAQTKLGIAPYFVAESVSLFGIMSLGICIGNSMVSSAIWKKHARVSFSKTIEIARVRRTSAI